MGRTGADGAVDGGGRDGRRRCLCLVRVRGRSQSPGTSRGWEKLAFWGCLLLFITTEARPYTSDKHSQGNLRPALSRSTSYPPAHVAMSQLIEKNVSIDALRPTRSRLRAITLIASCTGAMIVNVSPASAGPSESDNSHTQRLRRTRPLPLLSPLLVTHFESHLISCNGSYLLSPLVPAVCFSSLAASQIFTAERKPSSSGPWFKQPSLSVVVFLKVCSPSYPSLTSLIPPTR